MVRTGLSHTISRQTWAARTSGLRKSRGWRSPPLSDRNRARGGDIRYRRCESRPAWAARDYLDYLIGSKTVQMDSYGLDRCLRLLTVIRDE